MENIKIKCDGYKGRLLLFLDEKNIIFKKKKWFLSNELVDVDSFAIRDIRENKGKYLIRQTGENVEVITINKGLVLRFQKIDEAKNFYNTILELKKNDTFIKRNVEKLRNINEDDVKKAAKKVIDAIGFVAVIVKASKEISEKGKVVIDGIKTLFDKKK